MSWLRLFVVPALAGTAVAASGTSTEASEPGFIPGTGPCTAVPAGLNLIIPHSGGVAMTNSEGYEMLDVSIAGGPSKAVRGPDGTVWAEATHEGVRGVHRVPPGTSEVLSADGSVMLSSVGWLDGRTAAAIIDHDDEQPGDAPEEEYGAVLVEFADGQQVKVSVAGGIEYGVGSATIGAGRIAEGASVDLGESFGYYSTSGASLTDWVNPAARGDDAAPPFYQWPIAANTAGSPGGVTLSWVEGPEWDSATGRPSESWALVLADAVTGTESLRLDLGDAGDELLHADFDGRFWVGTFDLSPVTGPESPAPDPGLVLVVDTQAASPAVVDATCPPGVTATIDRLGTPAPPSTAPPPTNADAPFCDGYVTHENEYPIRRCHQGGGVVVIQQQLVARGYDIETDGFFGPNTEQAVLDFQRANGLAVDALVGPDTWTALYTGDPPGADNDGNGMIDPWEVPLHSGDSVPNASDAVGASVEVRDARLFDPDTLEVTSLDPNTVVWT